MSERVVIMMAGGGFSSQLFSLLSQLDKRREYFYLVPDVCWSLTSRLPVDRCIRTPALAQSFASGVRASPIFWLQLFMCHWRNLRKIDPGAVICLGSTEALPVSLAARSLGIKVIFIESIARVIDLSRTGKMIYRLGLANRFYVQWPRLAKTYPKALYRGIVHDLRNRGLDPV